MNALQRAWKGQSRLWVAFWVWPIALGVLWIIPVMAVSFAAGEESSQQILEHMVWLLLALLAYYLPLVAFICVSIWRCAFNCGWRGWGYLARVYVVLTLLGFAINLLWVGSLYVLFSNFNTDTPLVDGENPYLEAPNEAYPENTQPHEPSAEIPASPEDVEEIIEDDTEEEQIYDDEGKLIEPAAPAN